MRLSILFGLVADCDVVYSIEFAGPAETEIKLIQTCVGAAVAALVAARNSSLNLPLLRNTYGYLQPMTNQRPYNAVLVASRPKGGGGEGGGVGGGGGKYGLKLATALGISRHSRVTTAYQTDDLAKMCMQHSGRLGLHLYRLLLKRASRRPMDSSTPSRSWSRARMTIAARGRGCPAAAAAAASCAAPLRL